MNRTDLIKQGLFLKGLPIYETDIQHIQNIHFTINQAQTPLNAFPNLNKTVPITVVDKRLMLWQN
ncbi:hypothetical protein [Tenuibacillus multivorans]|uniref:Uncharacterized protein n=1 Tax=Tenuibacillus multivorans TaxID=237069 RepID=A0A1H0FQB4_9BACI|nr:hypothetical protein [Tenuibacillus multivorans]GEL77927.1 hypothetical protein TMU01_21620 [Tenuibacillus multivorans]SDN96868.1 hypothetical protein SAMN05216498_0318 [Tenuibacillus multivorans]